VANEKLPREEWIFFHAKKGCPKWQLPYCAYYEFARESAYIQKIFEQRPHAQISFLNFAEPSFFPRVPWLSVPAAKREYWLAGIGVLKDEVQAFRNIIDMGGGQHLTEIPPPPPRHEIEPAYFMINWREPNTVLKRRFAGWLKANHPPGIGVITSTGRTAVTDNLRRLAALRLLKVYTWDEAANLTKEVIGRELYADQASWLRAKRAAKKIIADLEKRRGPGLDP
jgi:hypothetical protein